MAVVLITGASSGIGHALAQRLAASGDAVALVARRVERLDSLVETIRQEGGTALALPCDVTDRQALADAARRAEAELGPIEVLVANAGGGGPSYVDDFSAEEISATLELNVTGVANAIEAVLPGMLERGSGHLLAVSSLAGSRGLPTGAAYAAAKAGLNALMESLRIDLRGRGLDVTIVTPGPVRRKEKSKKSRLFSVGLDEAAARIEAAIRSPRPWLGFPWTVALPVSMGRILPTPLYDRLVAGRGPKRKRTRPA